MMVNKKILLISIIVILVLLLNLELTGYLSLNNSDKIKIGVLTDLSGGMSSFGENVKKGIELAKTNENIKVIYQDSGCDVKQANNAIKKLVEIDDVDIVYGTVCSHVTLASSEITQKNDVLLFSIAASSPDITYAGDLVYRLWPSDLLESKKIIEYISKDRSDIENISLIYMNNEYGVSVKDALVNYSKQNNIQIKSIEGFLQKDTDFKTQLIKIKNKDPDALFIIANPSEAKIIFSQINELDMDVQLFAPGWLMEDKIIMDSVNNNILEKTIFPSIDFKISKEFEDILNNNSNKIITALSYDGYKILEDGVDLCGKNIDCIKKYLDNLEYNGMSGNIKFNEYGDVEKDFVIKTFKDGEVVVSN